MKSKSSSLFLGLGASLGLLIAGQASAETSLNDDLAALCAAQKCAAYSVESSDGAQIAVKDWAPKIKGGPTLLLIHGFPHGQGLWINQVAAKSLTGSGIKVVTMDVRGSGLSSCKTAEEACQYEAQNFGDDIQAVINRLGLKKVILVGHSYGGIVALAYVATHGTSQLAGLVEVSTMYNLPDAVIPEDTHAIIGDSIFAEEPRYSEATREFVELSHYPTPFSTSLTEKLFNMDMETPQAARQGVITSGFANNPDNEVYVRQVNVPVLILHGLSDIVILPETSDKIQQELTSSPRVQRVNFSNVGHLPMLEATDAFNKALAKFASGL